jgi:hypothetical protein
LVLLPAFPLQASVRVRLLPAFPLEKETLRETGKVLWRHPPLRSKWQRQHTHIYSTQQAR